MPRDRRAETGALRLRLLAGAAVVALASWTGAAQAQQAPAAAVPEARPGPDGLAPEAVYVDAATASRDGDVISAAGGADRVLARFRNTTLRAGRLTYDLNAGVATADDRVEFVDPDGNVVFASHLELD